jgi:aminoglycoside phosphotransferase (APT) family kinase protein
MHEDQLDLDTDVVAALVREQHPQWDHLPLRPVPSHGTVHLLWRLGDELVLRFPMQGGDARATERRMAAEAEAARWVAGRVPVTTPEPVALGRPGSGWPQPGAVYRWLPGDTASEVDVADSPCFARDVGAVVTSLWAQPTGGRQFAGAGRGGLLTDHDGYVAAGLARAHGLVDTTALAELWARLRTTPRCEPDTWTHGDLMPGNLLVADGRLVGLIDAGGVAVADPALDLMPAWNLMTARSRLAFRATVEAGQAAWDRGRGWALAQAVGCLWYYRETNPVMSSTAHRTLTALLEDAAW